MPEMTDGAGQVVTPTEMRCLGVEAGELNLSIAKEDTQLEKLIWEAFVGLESYMEFRIPFIPLQAYLSNAVATATIRPKPHSGWNMADERRSRNRCPSTSVVDAATR
jgi:hypothetical protein